MKLDQTRSVSSIFNELKDLKNYNNEQTETIPAKIFKSSIMWNSIEYLKNINNSFNETYINLALTSSFAEERISELTIIVFNEDRSINKVICLDAFIYDRMNEKEFRPKFPLNLIESNKITTFCNTEYEQFITKGDYVGLYGPKQLGRIISVLRKYRKTKCITKIKTAQHYHKLVERIYPYIQFPKRTAPFR
jgi:hypothetical protein